MENHLVTMEMFIKEYLKIITYLKVSGGSFNQMEPITWLLERKERRNQHNKMLSFSNSVKSQTLKVASSVFQLLQENNE